MLESVTGQFDCYDDNAKIGVIFPYIIHLSPSVHTRKSLCHHSVLTSISSAEHLARGMTPLYGVLSPLKPVLVHRTLRSLGCRMQCARWLHHVGPIRHPSTQADDEYEHFGSYEVILPKEPFVWGVSHIKARHVPVAIPRPLYGQKHRDMAQDHAEPDVPEPYEGDGRIHLSSIEETKLRESAKLASKVRQYASGLVKVRGFSRFAGM